MASFLDHSCFENRTFVKIILPQFVNILIVEDLLMFFLYKMVVPAGDGTRYGG